MKTSLGIYTTLISPPGDTILEHIDFIGMTQSEFAEKMGLSNDRIRELIQGKDTITMETAIQLEKVLEIPASFWIERELIFRKELYELK